MNGKFSCLEQHKDVIYDCEFILLFSASFAEGYGTVKKSRNADQDGYVAESVKAGPYE